MTTPKPFYVERKITKIFRDRNPQGTGLVWRLAWNEGWESYTIDSASGVGRFRLLDELRMHQDHLDEKLLKRYHKLENQKGHIHAT